MIKTNNIHNFTGEQLIVYEKFKDLCRERGGAMLLVQGYAGTGKTYCISKFVDELLNVFQAKVAVTSPTHKATRILLRETGLEHKNLKFSTIHSALGLTANIDGFGKQTFKRDPKTPCKLGKYDYLIVDEVSMLDDILFYDILQFVKKGLKVIFLGDPAQIPPVNKPDCIPFKEADQKEYGIEVVKLTQIVRQEEGNPIIDTTFEIRNNLFESHSIKNRVSRTTSLGSITFLSNSKREDQDELFESLNTLFTSKEYKQDVDHVKVLAWRNETVNTYNELIRYMIFGENLKKLMVGERLIIDKPVIDAANGKIILNTNDEVEVKEYDINYEYMNSGKAKIFYYDASVEFERLDGSFAIKKIKIIHEESEETYNKLTDELKKKALKERQGSDKAKLAWIKYYQFQDNYAQIKYAYAVTSHKSQGSTYKNAVVLEFDITLNKKNIEETNRILYTATSRPKNNLVIVGK